MQSIGLITIPVKSRKIFRRPYFGVIFRVVPFQLDLQVGFVHNLK